MTTEHPLRDDDTARILAARARELARPAAPPTVPGGVLELLAFTLAQESYAVEARHVRVVLPLKDLLPLPGVPRFMVGVVNVRGQILPVVDIRKFFALAERGLADLHCVMVVHGDEFDVGLLADAIAGVHAIPANYLQPATATITGIRGDFVKGVTAERMVVLDLERILRDPTLIVHEEVVD